VDDDKISKSVDVRSQVACNDCGRSEGLRLLVYCRAQTSLVCNKRCTWRGEKGKRYPRYCQASWRRSGGVSVMITRDPRGNGGRSV